MSDYGYGLWFLGIVIDDEANIRLRGEGEIGAGNSTVRVIVVKSRKDVVIARAARRFAATTVGNEPVGTFTTIPTRGDRNR